MAKKITKSDNEQSVPPPDEQQGNSSSEEKMLKLARERVITAFESHWRKILRSRKDIAKERACYFLAGSTSARERLSRSFYDREHARQMAGLNTAEIRETLAPWLECAVRFWLDRYTEIGDLQGDDFLSELPTAEYVTIIDLHSSFTGGVHVDRYPGERVLYDDLYERMLSGLSSGGILRVYKATGERFTPFEARSVRAGIRRQLLSVILSYEGKDHSWLFDMQAEGNWESEGFEGEDFERVVMVEVSE